MTESTKSEPNAAKVQTSATAVPEFPSGISPTVKGPPLTTDARRSEDVRKLHGEINQIVNQRFLITTVAVTVFGVMMTRFVETIAPSGASASPRQFYSGPILLLILLALLYTTSYALKEVLRTLTIYLEVFELSDWEKHWSAYRKVDDRAYTKIQTIFFVAFGVLVAVSCIAIRWPLSPEDAWAGLLLAGYFGWIMFMYKGGSKSEKDVWKRWRDIKNPPSPTE